MRAKRNFRHLSVKRFFFEPTAEHIARFCRICKRYRFRFNGVSGGIFRIVYTAVQFVGYCVNRRRPFCVEFLITIRTKRNFRHLIIESFFRKPTCESISRSCRFFQYICLFDVIRFGVVFVVFAAVEFIGYCVNNGSPFCVEFLIAVRAKRKSRHLIIKRFFCEPTLEIVARSRRIFQRICLFDIVRFGVVVVVFSTVQFIGNVIRYRRIVRNKFRIRQNGIRERNKFAVYFPAVEGVARLFRIFGCLERGFFLHFTACPRFAVFYERVGFHIKLIHVQNVVCIVFVAVGVEHENIEDIIPDIRHGKAFCRDFLRGQTFKARIELPRTTVADGNQIFYRKVRRAIVRLNRDFGRGLRIVHRTADHVRHAVFKPVCVQLQIAERAFFYLRDFVFCREIGRSEPPAERFTERFAWHRIFERERCAFHRVRGGIARVVCTVIHNIFDFICQ